MRNILASFKQLLMLVINDSMLIILCIGPIMFGLAVKLGIPLLNDVIIKQYTSFYNFEDYYQMIDLLLLVMIPLLICFISAMVVLEEIDDGTSRYLMVTPLKSSGYLFSRIALPCFASLFITICIGYFCSLIQLSPYKLIVLSIISSITALTQVLLIVCLAKNKVEGMAICKISSIVILGIPIPYFISGTTQYIFSFLPSFWIAKYAIESNIIYAIICLVVSAIWIIVLSNKFKNKVAK